MGYNLNTEFAKDFLTKFENEYKTGLEHLRETHDSWVFFQLRLGFEDQTPFLNLNPTPKDNKSPFINFSMKDINNNLSSIALEILANELKPFVKNAYNKNS